MVKVLMTGFAPFGGEQSNPSWEAVRQVQGHRGTELRTEELPVTFAGAGRRMTELLQEFKPDLVVMVGLAAGRKGFSVERVALNLADARIPDNEGAQPVDAPVDSSGPAAIFTNVNAKRLAETLRQQGVDTIAGRPVLRREDYLLSVVTGADGSQSPLDLPKSDVLKLFVEDGWVALRPSGTEPKIKYYVSATSGALADALAEDMGRIIGGIQ